MKKLSIVIIVFALINCDAKAQTGNTRMDASKNNTDFQQYFTIGPRLGANISTITGVNDLSSKAGLLVGGFILYSFQEHFGISADMLFSMEGARFTDRISIGNVSIKTENNISLAYLRIPLQANVFFGDHGNTFRPKITLGPSLGILLGARNKFTRITTDANGSTVTVESKDDVKSNFKSVDIGAVIGTGFNYRVAELVWLNFDLRYTIGATEINDTPTNSNSDKLRNNAFSASLGLGIGL